MKTSPTGLPSSSGSGPNPRRRNPKSLSGCDDGRARHKHQCGRGDLCVGVCTIDQRHDERPSEELRGNRSAAPASQPPLLPWLQKLMSNYVVTYHGDRVFSVKKAFQRLPKIAKGLPERISPYCIRHTMAKELRRRGVLPWEVQGMLGHKAAKLRTTEIYAKYDPSYLSAARVAIDEVMADIDAKMTKRKIILPSQPQLVAVGAKS